MPRSRRRHNPIKKIVRVDFTKNMSPHSLGCTSITTNQIEMQWATNESYYGLHDNAINYPKGEIYIKYDLWFGPNFDFGQGMKIGRLRSYNDVGPVQYWDFIPQITSAGNAAAQAGATESFQVTISRNSGATWATYNKTFVRSQTYTFQYRFKCNSALGVADGIVQMWIDGVMVINVQNLDLMVGVLNGYSKLINRWIWGGWYSNGSGGNPNPHPEPGPNIMRISNGRHSAKFIP
jgi:hypothetical protein